eukprot:g16567.t1
MFAFRHTDTSVEVEAESAPSLVPAVGTNVLARVVRLAPDRAECLIVALDDVPLSEKFRGIIRKQDVRFFEAMDGRDNGSAKAG